jgi:hypothetical protein
MKNQFNQYEIFKMWKSDKYKRTMNKKPNRAHQTKHRLSTQISIRWTVLNLISLVQQHQQKYASNICPTKIPKTKIYWVQLIANIFKSGSETCT